MLKFMMDSMDDLSDDIKKLYTKSDTDNKFYLTGVSGITTKEKVDEFRTNNIDLLEKLKVFKDIDVSKYHDLLNEEEKRDGKKTILVKDLEIKVNEGVEKRVGEMKAEFVTEKTVLTDNIGVMQRQLESLLVDNEVRSAASEHGVLSTAIDDVIFRAKSTFKVDKGKVIGYKGEDKLYDKSGENLLSINAWVKQLDTVAPHLFTSSSGGNMVDGKTGKVDTKNMSALQKIQLGLNKN